MMELAVLSPGDNEYRELDNRLVAFNRRHVEWDTQTFQITLKSNQDKLVGGACAIIRMRTAEIRGLWVDENIHSQGHGSRIITLLEKEARKRGAQSALLDTYDFQAQAFYERLGYEVFGTYVYPDGTSRIYLSKQL